MGGGLTAAVGIGRSTRLCAGSLMSQGADDYQQTLPEVEECVPTSSLLMERPLFTETWEYGNAFPYDSVTSGTNNTTHRPLVDVPPPPLP